VCHQANKAYCESLGDFSQVDWEQAPEWQKSSVKTGVRFKISNPEVTPEASHENWLKVKREEGWVYGETKDPEKKTHPCILPFYELPKEQQVKDHLFVAVVKTLLKYT
jgi:hypothetical protein